MNKKLFIVPFAAVIALLSWAFIPDMTFHTVGDDKNADVKADTVIKWYNIKEAQELNAKEHRKMFVDMYTSWCGWCKVMDKNTFSNPVIAKYMNKHFYPVKFDAETTDTVFFGGQMFVNHGSPQTRNPHDFAIAVLQGKMSYPSFAFIDQGPNGTNITIMQGYLPPEQFEPYMHYYGENLEKTVSWEEFLRTFKSELNQPAAPSKK
ncbi:MAG: hypothetical protein Fur0041_04380 [Bacteroidia bacterium]